MYACMHACILRRGWGAPLDIVDLVGSIAASRGCAQAAAVRGMGPGPVQCQECRLSFKNLHVIAGMYTTSTHKIQPRDTLRSELKRRVMRGT